VRIVPSLICDSRFQFGASPCVMCASVVHRARYCRGAHLPSFLNPRGAAEVRAVLSNSKAYQQSQPLAEAAAVSAIASGSQHRTMSATSYRIARSLSTAAPGTLSMKMTFQTVVSFRLPV
jgi:hypothetical protein